MLSGKLIMKISYCFLAVLALCSCAATEPAISNDEPAKEPATQVMTPAEPVHVHSGDSQWSVDSEIHWRYCSCGKRTDTGIHSLSESGLCTGCDYQISSNDETKSVSLLNEHGDPVKTLTYSSGSFLGEETFEYKYTSDGKITQITTQKNGKRVSQISYDANGNISAEMIYGYSEESYQLFTNYADGYSLRLPMGFEVDSSLSEIVTTLENDKTQIEIYKQSLSEFGSGSYRTYSNAFLKNTIDHTTDLRGTRYIGDKNTYVVAWHRDKLSKIENDKNHYASFDIKRGNYVYTIFVKSAAPAPYENFSFLVENISFFQPTAEHTPWRSTTVAPENRGWNEETLSFYNKYFSSDASLSWGFFDPESAYGDMTEVREFEEILDYKFPVILTYFDASQKIYQRLQKTLEASWENGNVLELTVQTYATADGGNMVYDILNGELDEALEYYAKTISNFGHPVLFRLMNEMNGDWCRYCAYHTSRDAQIYKEAYIYVYRIFEESGADNVIWVWNPNEGSFPNFDWNHSLMYYPGDEYVDIVGMTAYNTGNYYTSYGERWKTFTELYDNLYTQYCDYFTQPFMITEFSCAKKGGNKTAWVEDMFEQITKYDRIKLAVWWNHVDYDSANGKVSRNYLIDDPISVLEVFKENI